MVGKKRATRRPTIEPRALTRAEAAQYLGLGLSSFSKLVADGRVRALHYDGVERDYYDRRSLDELIDSAVTANGATDPTGPTSGPTGTDKYGFLRIARGRK